MTIIVINNKQIEYKEKIVKDNFEMNEQSAQNII
jgi:hypothetical protein